MIILGIDPGTTTTGYGTIYHQNNKLSLKECGCIETKPKENSLIKLRKIYDEICFLIDKHKPDAVAVERLFFNVNTKTALDVGEARGIILLAVSQFEVEFAEYTPLQVKMSLAGYGRAKKDQIQYMVKTLLRLPSTPKPDDVADALAIAICHAHSYKLNQQVKRKA
ncbi:MAG: crossover junction endodeoxyribonuclease RuvC [Actinobacteria bacterium]|nr:crossover junction endodeoxyribonuclease RuvC [Actinomycetota bacterium]